MENGSSLMNPTETARAEILDVWTTQLEAMDNGDTEALRACCTNDMTLTHLTGYRQPLTEWLAGIRGRQFVYHRLVERSVEITDVKDMQAKLVGHITTGITDDGSGHAWQLRMEQGYVRRGDEWLCSASRVSLG